MSHITPALTLIVLGAGALAGALGAVLGIGGGVFLVPLLHLLFDLPIKDAAGISLATVIATSSIVSARRSDEALINFRVAMLLEVATVAGSLLGGITAQLLAQATLQRMFGAVAAVVAVIMLGRLQRRNILLDPAIDPGVLGGRYYEDESGRIVAYRVKRLPVALFASFIAGNVSSLLGIGGGVIKVPVLNAWCGVPLRAAAATSAFMIGVTAASGAIIYYGHGLIVPPLAAAAVLGVLAGSDAGLRFAARAPAKSLKLMMAAVLFVVSVVMLVRGFS